MRLRLAISLAISIFYGSAAFAETRVAVDWVFVETRQGSGEVLRSPASTLFILKGRSITDTNGTEARFGKTAKGVSKQFGIDYSVNTRISNSRLVKIVHVGGVNVKTVVKSIGADGCQAGVTYFKSPGKRFFEASNINYVGVFSDTYQGAENVRCVISND